MATKWGVVRAWYHAFVKLSLNPGTSTTQLKSQQQPLKRQVFYCYSVDEMGKVSAWLGLEASMTQRILNSSRQVVAAVVVVINA